MKMKAVVLAVLGLAIGSQLFAAPKYTKAVTDKNVKLLEVQECFDIFEIKLTDGNEFVYCCNKDGHDMLVEMVKILGVPDIVTPDNTVLDPHVAKVTKLYGSSFTSIQTISGISRILNTYDEKYKTFQYFQWN